MLNHFTLKTSALTWIVGVGIAAALSACHSSEAAHSPASTSRPAVAAASGPMGSTRPMSPMRFMDAELTPPFDDTPITPMETVGAPAARD
jgi:hypothetical protein